MPIDDRPLVKYDFSDARIEAVSIGPRREATLRIALLKWQGTRGEYSETLLVRFGGIENFPQVAGFFAEKPHEVSELASLSYSAPPKAGKLSIDLKFERIDSSLNVQCSSVQVSPADTG